MFKDLPEGQTHFQNDGCGQKEHNMKTKEEIINECLKEFDNVWGGYNHKADTKGLDYHIKQFLKQSLFKIADEFENFKVPDLSLSRSLESFTQIPQLPLDIKKKVEAWQKKGFDKIAVFNSPPHQMANADFYWQQAIHDDQQYDPYFEDKVKKSTITNRPDGAYVLLYSSGDVPQETKNKTPDELEKLFTKNKWNGLTLPEWLVLQKLEPHEWSAYDWDSQKSNWTWLLDSTIGTDKVVSAYWYPDFRQVGAEWLYRDNSYGVLGARPVVVIPL